MKNFINLKDIPAKDLRKILDDAKKRINKIVLNARNYVIEFYEKSGYKAVRKYEGSDTGIPHTTMEKIL